jgi:hypothetical protein
MATVPEKVAALERALAQVRKGQRLAHGASIENAAVTVNSGSGQVRAILGVQGDGTVGVQAVNGPPPPQPSDPIVASVLGGVTVSWDGLFAGGTVIPMDWQRVEVHASITPVYTPVPATLVTTIETAQGATVVHSCDTPVYVRLLARNTSGAASPPSVTVGPFGPTPVVADDILDGIVTTLKLADDAVTSAKVAAGAIDTDALANAAVTAAIIAADAVTNAAIAAGAVGNTEISDGAITTPKLVASVITANELAATCVTAAKIAAGAVIAGKLDASSVVAGNIAAAAVQAGNLAANSVQAGNIAANAVQAGTVDANAITARELNALAVTAGKLAVNSVAAGNIQAGAVTATALTVGIAQAIASKMVDAMGDSTLWTQTSDAGTPTWLTAVSDAAAGGTVAQAAGPVTLERNVNTPYDPDTMYRVTARVRTTTAPSAGTANVSMGLVGIAADGTTRVSSTGANAVVTGQHYIAANAVTVSVGTAWTTFTGYVQGTASTGTTAASPDPKSPGKVHTNVRYVRPVVRLLTGATGGVMQVDQVTVETLPTGVVNTVNIADGAITAAKITAGAVDATALSATAITGKTITGGTITGALIQTAASGQRITLNESSANKVLVYDSSGTAIGELSASGLLVKGTNGAILWLDPNDVFPNLRLTNAAGTNSAVINVSGSAAVLGMNSGLFTAGAFSDMKWRTIFGSALGTDFWCAERVRDSDTSVYLGGRIFLSSTSASIGFRNSADSTQDAVLTLQQGVGQINKARLEIFAPASSSAALYVNAETGHTASLVRAQYNSVDKFKVDKDGNATVAGNLTVSGIGSRQTKYRTSNATKTSNTTLATDTQITFAVDAGAVYTVEGLLLHSGPGDFKMGWTFPSGTDGTWQGLGNGVTVISGTSGGGTQQDTSSTWGYAVRTESTDLASPRTYGGIAANGYGVQVKATVRVGGTAGTFALQWAQGTSDATATTLYLDSYLTLERVA